MGAEPTWCSTHLCLWRKWENWTGSLRSTADSAANSFRVSGRGRPFSSSLRLVLCLHRPVTHVQGFTTRQCALKLCCPRGICIEVLEGLPRFLNN
jgi:hypothetical protein